MTDENREKTADEIREAAGEERPPTTRGDPETPIERERYAEMAEEVERLLAAASRLRELGAAADVPAIERNAKRVEGVATTLADNLPPELTEE